MATDVLPCRVLLTPVVVQEQTSSWLRASCHHLYPSLSMGRQLPGAAVAEDQRGLLACEHDAASLQQGWPCLSSIPSSDIYLLSAESCLAAEFNPLLYWHRDASITKAVVPNSGICVPSGVPSL